MTRRALALPRSDTGRIVWAVRCGHECVFEAGADGRSAPSLRAVWRDVHGDGLFVIGKGCAGREFRPASHDSFGLLWIGEDMICTDPTDCHRACTHYRDSEV